MKKPRETPHVEMGEKRRGGGRRRGGRRGRREGRRCDCVESVNDCCEYFICDIEMVADERSFQWGCVLDRWIITANWNTLLEKKCFYDVKKKRSEEKSEAISIRERRRKIRNVVS